MHVFLETERLILRRFTEDDADNLVELDSDPDVMHYITGGKATSREMIETDHLPHFLDYYERGERYGFWAVVEKATGDFVGWFHFRPPYGETDPDVAELGYRFRQAAWGKGYATEGSLALIDKGFRELGVKRVTAYTFEKHQASRRVMEKVGMTFVRTFRMTPEQLEAEGLAPEDFWDGDDVEYAIDKADWERMQASGT